MMERAGCLVAGDHMEIEIHITSQPIVADAQWAEKFSGQSGAIAEFSGIVRNSENGEKISALEYESYSPMAENEMRRILESLAKEHPCLAAKVLHRIGIIPVGEAAIYIGVASGHRGEAFALLAEFMNRLKQDVPIWKIRSHPEPKQERGAASGGISERRLHDQKVPGHRPGILSLDEALAEILSRCLPLTAERVRLFQAAGRVLRETVCAAEDFPAFDRSTRDGYAILADDNSEIFSVVDTLHAADWKPRDLNPGEAIRVATGTSLSCENLRVVMQENVERTGSQIKILRHAPALNIRKRGEEMRGGDPVLKTGAKLDAGALALLATVGCTQPLVSRRLNVVHFTTGDEIMPPEATPKPGQIRDSNSILIRSLLQESLCEVDQQHLPEDFELAKLTVGKRQPAIENADVVLVSGGASVGDKDFTRPLLEWLGFKIVFGRTNIRPGAPLIFGVDGRRAAFGLPGNPVSHFVCYHLFVTAALARFAGAETPKFASGTLAMDFEDAPNPRETLWPARCEMRDGKVELHPLRWSSSGDVVVLAKTNALIRVPPNASPLAAGKTVDFLPTSCLTTNYAR